MTAELEHVSRALHELDDHELAVAREACTALLEAVVSRGGTERLLTWAVEVISSVSQEGMQRAATIARASASVDGHDLTVAQRPDGMWMATCSCGWRGWPCPDASEADDAGQGHAEYRADGAWHQSWGDFADREGCDFDAGFAWYCMCGASQDGFPTLELAEITGEGHEIMTGGSA